MDTCLRRYLREGTLDEPQSKLRHPGREAIRDPELVRRPLNTGSRTMPLAFPG